MKLRLFSGLAALVVGLMGCASSASAALTYFDAQIHDITVGKATILKNTVMCNPGQNCAETPFTALPFGPGTEGPPATTDPNGNWTRNNANPIPPGTVTGDDNAWNQRVNNVFGNPDASGNGTIYEARGQNGGPNTEDPPVLKTTVNVPLADQGTLRGVYALFWTDSSNWRISACMDCVEDEFMPIYQASFQEYVPNTHVFGVYDVGVGDVNNRTLYDLEMNGFTTTDAIDAGAAGGNSNRRLAAAWLGNVVLGQTLTVYVGDGPPLTETEMLANGGANHRTWYDGIAYGDVQNLVPLTCEVPPVIPEPASAALFGLGLSVFALKRRRS
jgi:hypothetical protein